MTRDNIVGDKVMAPFTDYQVAQLNRFQRYGKLHPLTCPADGTDGANHHIDVRSLVAKNAGWYCRAPGCAYKQAWAPSFMLELDL